MSWARSQWGGGAAKGAVAVAVLFLGIVAAQAQSTAADGPTGRIDFAAASLPPATVEVDLTQDMFGDLIGLGDAAVAGVVNRSCSRPGRRVATRKLSTWPPISSKPRDRSSNRQQGRPRSARVRVYKNLGDKAENMPDMLSRFDGQLSSGGWDTVVRMRDSDESVRVSLVRSEGAIRGAFVVVADGEDVVLVNVVCDVSPENVKKLSAAATKIGLDNGLEEAIKAKLLHKH